MTAFSRFANFQLAPGAGNIEALRPIDNILAEYDPLYSLPARTPVPASFTNLIPLTIRLSRSLAWPCMDDRKEETMTDLQELQTQRAELIRRRLDTEAAERARREAEAEPARQLAAIDQQLAEIEAQVNAERRAQALEHNQTLVEANTRAVNALTTQLAQLEHKFNDLSAIPQVEVSFERQQNHAAAAAQTLARPAMPWPLPAGTSMNELTWEQQQAVEQYEQAARNARGQMTTQMQAAQTVEDAIARWVVALDDPRRLRVRQGIGFALTGRIFGPTR